MGHPAGTEVGREGTTEGRSGPRAVKTAKSYLLYRTLSLSHQTFTAWHRLCANTVDGRIWMCCM